MRSDMSLSTSVIHLGGDEYYLEVESWRCIGSPLAVSSECRS